MRVRIQRTGGRTLVVDDAVLMVVEDDKGDPVSVACEHSLPGSRVRPTTVSHAKDPGFNRVLRGLGLRRTVIARSLDDLLVPSDELPWITPEPR